MIRVSANYHWAEMASVYIYVGCFGHLSKTIVFIVNKCHIFNIP